MCQRNKTKLSSFSRLYKRPEIIMMISVPTKTCYMTRKWVIGLKRKFAQREKQSDFCLKKYMFLFKIHPLTIQFSIKVLVVHLQFGVNKTESRFKYIHIKPLKYLFTNPSYPSPFTLPIGRLCLVPEYDPFIRICSTFPLSIIFCPQ